MIERIEYTGRVPESIWKKLNPLWWLVGPDGWNAPTINNGTPYLPDVTNVWLRRFYWFICRNPLMNFVGFVLGVEDKDYTAFGTAPVDRTTGRDCSPVQLGWRGAVLFPSFSLGASLVTMAAATLALFWWPLWIVTVFAGLKIVGPLPFLSFYNGKVEAYLGWRPVSGGYGAKFVMPQS